MYVEGNDVYLPVRWWSILSVESRVKTAGIQNCPLVRIGRRHLSGDVVRIGWRTVNRA